MSKIHYYQVKASWNNNRNGVLSSKVLDETITIATPPEFSKGEANVWSPEHYYLAAINGCLLTTFLAVAENFKLKFSNFESDSIGKLEVVERQFIISEVTLTPIVTINEKADESLALKVIEKAERACLISNSVKSKIVMKPTIIVQQ